MQETMFFQIAVTVLNVIFLGLFGWGLHALHRVIARVERMEQKISNSVEIIEKLWSALEKFEDRQREDMKESGYRHEELRKRVQELERGAKS